MRHSKEAKEQATAKMREGQTPLFEIAHEFQVSTNTLRTWLRESDARNQAQESAKRAGSVLTKERRTAISQRQRLLMHAVDQSPSTIIVTDEEGRIVFANPKFIATTGYRVDEAIGKTPSLLKSGETTQEEYKQLWKTIKSGKEWRGIFHNKRKNGTLYWERASISPVRDGKGKIAYFMAVKEDITEFIEAENTRKRTAAGYCAALEALPIAVMLVDAMGCVVKSNSAADRMLGPQSASGKKFEELNLLWVDEEGKAIAIKDHPLMRLLKGDPSSAGVRQKIGVAAPKGGVQWVIGSAHSLGSPANQNAVAMLVLDSNVAGASA